MLLKKPFELLYIHIMKADKTAADSKQTTVFGPKIHGTKIFKTSGVEPAGLLP